MTCNDQIDITEDGKDEAMTFVCEKELNHEGMHCETGDLGDNSQYGFLWGSMVTVEEQEPVTRSIQ